MLWLTIMSAQLNHRIATKKYQPKPYISISLKKIVEAAKQEASGSKTSAYFATTITTGILYIIISIITFILIPSQFYVMVWILLSFFFALSFSPIRYSLEELIRQLFPQTDYNAHEIIKNLNTISYSSLTLNRLSNTFSTEFETNLNIPESAFIFLKSPQNIIIKASDHFRNLQSLNSQEISLLSKHAQHHRDIITASTNEYLDQLFQSYHIKLALPLTNNDILVGILLLGHKFNQKHYTTKDMKVLTAIAPKLVLLLKMLTLTNELKIKMITSLASLKKLIINCA